MSQKSSSLARNIVKFVIMTIGLGIIGLAFGLAGAFIGGKVLGGDSIGFGALSLAILGIIIGYPTGIIVGIVLIKKDSSSPWFFVAWYSRQHLRSSNYNSCRRAS